MPALFKKALTIKRGIKSRLFVHHLQNALALERGNRKAGSLPLFKMRSP